MLNMGSGMSPEETPTSSRATAKVGGNNSTTKKKNGKSRKSAISTSSVSKRLKKIFGGKRNKAATKNQTETVYPSTDLVEDVAVDQERCQKVETAKKMLTETANSLNASNDVDNSKKMPILPSQQQKELVLHYYEEEVTGDDDDDEADIHSAPAVMSHEEGCTTPSKKNQDERKNKQFQKEAKKALEAARGDKAEKLTDMPALADHTEEEDPEVIPEPADDDDENEVHSKTHHKAKFSIRQKEENILETLISLCYMCFPQFAAAAKACGPCKGSSFPTDLSVMTEDSDLKQLASAEPGLDQIKQVVEERRQQRRAEQQEWQQEQQGKEADATAPTMSTPPTLHGPPQLDVPAQGSVTKKAASTETPSDITVTEISESISNMEDKDEKETETVEEDEEVDEEEVEEKEVEKVTKPMIESLMKDEEEVEEVTVPNVTPENETSSSEEEVPKEENEVEIRKRMEALQSEIEGTEDELMRRLTAVVEDRDEADDEEKESSGSFNGEEQVIREKTLKAELERLKNKPGHAENTQKKPKGKAENERAWLRGILSDISESDYSTFAFLSTGGGVLDSVSTTSKL